jgi:hypothetical protein
VKPVPDDHVNAVLRFLPPTLRAMVELQRLTGMRSGELCVLRSCDVDSAPGKIGINNRALAFYRNRRIFRKSNLSVLTLRGVSMGFACTQNGGDVSNGCWFAGSHFSMACMARAFHPFVRVMLFFILSATVFALVAGTHEDAAEAAECFVTEVKSRSALQVGYAVAALMSAADVQLTLRFDALISSHTGGVFVFAFYLSDLHNGGVCRGPPS